MPKTPIHKLFLQAVMAAFCVILLSGSGCQHGQATFKAGNEAYKQGAHETSYAKWKKLAMQGIPEAQYNLALLYRKGEGVEQNYEEAARWYKRAAIQGLEKAQYNLAIMHARGDGVPEDAEQAAFWYQKAAMQGHPKAQTNLANLYLSGEGVKQDYKQAYKWYSRATSQRDSFAQANFGWLFENGLGVEKDLVQAYIWFSVSVHNGYEGGTEGQQRVSARLTPAQKLDAEQRIKTCASKKYTDC